MGGRVSLRVGALSDPGRVRELNEDSLGTPELMGVTPAQWARKGALYAVADGMGGHAAGEVASRQAIAALFREYYADPSTNVVESLRRAYKVANAEIHAMASSDPTKEGMGTTLVAAVLKGDRLFVANVGDSRAYHVHQGRIHQITRDHSWVAEQVEAGVITKEEARQHAHRNVITRALGNRPNVEVDIFTEKIQTGDAIVLCSDGLSNELEDEEIGRIVAGNDPQKAANELVSLANQRGGDDNITAIVVKVTKVTKESTLSFALAAGGLVAILAICVIAFLVRHSFVLPGQVPTTMPILIGTPAGILTSTPTPMPISTPTNTAMPTSTPTPTLTPTPRPVVFRTDVPEPIEVEYKTQSGDTPVNIARRFGARGKQALMEAWGIVEGNPEILSKSSILWIGAPSRYILFERIKPDCLIEVTPSFYGVVIGGQVKELSSQQIPEGFTLVLDSKDLSKDYHVTLENRESSNWQEKFRPKNGDTVRVFGYRRGRILQAFIVDVFYDERLWHNWYWGYPHEESEPVWIYGKLNTFGIGGVDGLAGYAEEYEDRTLAAYGSWCKKDDYIAFRANEVYIQQGENGPCQRVEKGGGR